MYANLADKLSDIFYSNNLDTMKEHEKYLHNFELWVSEAAKEYRGFWCHDYDLLDIGISESTLREQGLDVRHVKKILTDARYERIESDCIEVRWVLGRNNNSFENRYKQDLKQLCFHEIRDMKSVS